MNRGGTSRTLEYSWHVFFGEPWAVPMTDFNALFSPIVVETSSSTSATLSPQPVPLSPDLTPTASVVVVAGAHESRWLLVWLFTWHCCFTFG